MMQHTVRSRFMLTALVAVAGGATSAVAQQQPAALQDADLGSRYEVEIGADWVSSYFFRGIRQEDDGFILQPYAELGVNLFEYEGGEVQAFVGTFNSVHTDNDTAGDGDSTSSWYEADFYVGAAATYEQFEVSVAYTWMTSPSSAFDTVEEVSVTVAYDDTDLGFYTNTGLEGFALNPYATIAIETDDSRFPPQNGQQFGDEGVYLELGISPAFELITEGDFEGTIVSFPIFVGLDITDYYEVDDAPAGSGFEDDSTFGFVGFGPQVEVPLPFDAEWGAWSLAAGVTVLYLNDNLETVNDDDDFEVIGNVGLSFNF